MKNRNLAIGRSTLSIVGSTLMFGLVAVACSDSSGAPEAAPEHASSGGATDVGRATSSGGADSTGGGRSNDTGTGGSSAGGTTAAAGGSRATGGARSGGDGTGGTTMGAGGSDDNGIGDVSSCVAETLTVPSNIPEILKAPDGATLIHHLHAAGTQNYKCTATVGEGDAGTTYSWVFIAPEAVLSNDCGKHVGTHFAGSGGATTPRWQWDRDGSFVQGVKAQASPVAGSIPALLLRATQNSPGTFGDVTFVQRLDPAGGAAPPATDCDSGNVDAVNKVGYSAEYYFYTGGADAGTR